MGSGSIQGRAEALQIILSLDPEEWPDDYITEHPIADTGDYEYNWNVDKLKELFHVGNEYKNSLFGKLAETVDQMYWEMAAKESDHDMFKKLVSQLIAQVEKGCISKEEHSPLEALKGWVK